MEILNDKPLVDIETIIYRKEVDLIYGILERDNALLITGIGGIGKTTIANLYHHRFKDKYYKILRFNYHNFIEPRNQIMKILDELNDVNEKSLLIIIMILILRDIFAYCSESAETLLFLHWKQMLFKKNNGY